MVMGQGGLHPAPACLRSCLEAPGISLYISWGTCEVSLQLCQPLGQEHTLQAAGRVCGVHRDSMHAK